MDQQFLLGMFSVIYAATIAAVVYLINLTRKSDYQIWEIHREISEMYRNSSDSNMRSYQDLENRDRRIYEEIQILRQEMKVMSSEWELQNDRVQASMEELIESNIDSLQNEITSCSDSVSDLTERVDSLADEVFDMQHFEEVANTKTIING